MTTAPEQVPAPDSCPWCWGSHCCDLTDGHPGDHQCLLGHEGDEPDVRPRGAPDVFHFRTDEPENHPKASGPCPDTRTASGGHVRTPAIVGEVIDCGPPPTRPDTIRTRPDTTCPDSPDGVRIEYRATVPRHLVIAALAEASGAISQTTQDRQDRP